MLTKYKRSSKSKTTPTGKNSKPTGTDKDLNLSSMLPLFTDEDKARGFLESKRWTGGKAICPHCGEGDAYKLAAKPGSSSPARPGVWNVADSASSALFAPARSLRKARFRFANRIRKSMKQEPLFGMLSGTVEVDVTDGERLAAALKGPKHID